MINRHPLFKQQFIFIPQLNFAEYFLGDTSINWNDTYEPTMVNIPSSAFIQVEYCDSGGSLTVLKAHDALISKQYETDYWNLTVAGSV